MTVKDLNRWEETDEPGVYRRRLVVPATEKPARLSKSIQPEVKATAGAIEAADVYGLDLAEITGTGKDGKITKADVDNFRNE